MPTNFPSSLDNYTRPQASDQLNSPSHAGKHDDAFDAIEALEAKVGVDGSAVALTHDWLLRRGIRYFPDAQPASAHASDVEFLSGELLTDWDPNATMTQDSSATRGLHLQMASVAGSRWGGRYKAAPASGDFFVATKAQLTGPRTPNNGAALVIGQDLAGNPNTSDVVILCAFADGNVRAQRWNQYDSFNTDYASFAYDRTSPTYLRVRIARGSTWYFDISTDAESWFQIASVAEPFSPAEVACGIYNEGSATIDAYFRFLRFGTSTAIDQRLLGREF